MLSIGQAHLAKPEKLLQLQSRDGPRYRVLPWLSLISNWRVIVPLPTNSLSPLRRISQPRIADPNARGNVGEAGGRGGNSCPNIHSHFILFPLSLSFLFLFFSAVHRQSRLNSPTIQNGVPENRKLQPQPRTDWATTFEIFFDQICWK